MRHWSRLNPSNTKASLSKMNFLGACILPPSAQKQVGFLYRNFRMADSRCLTYLYRSLVLPILDYCGAAWEPHQANNIQKLERVQHFAARLVTGQWSADRTTLCEQLGWSPFTRCRVINVYACVGGRLSRSRLNFQPAHVPSFSPSRLELLPIRPPFCQDRLPSSVIFW